MPAPSAPLLHFRAGDQGKRSGPVTCDQQLHQLSPDSRQPRRLGGPLGRAGALVQARGASVGAASASWFCTEWKAGAVASGHPSPGCTAVGMPRESKDLCGPISQVHCVTQLGCWQALHLCARICCLLWWEKEGSERLQGEMVLSCCVSLQGP